MLYLMLTREINSFFLSFKDMIGQVDQEVNSKWQYLNKVFVFFCTCWLHLNKKQKNQRRYNWEAEWSMMCVAY